MQYLIDSANNIPNCKLPCRKLGETKDNIIYRITFLDEDGVLRPYICTFSNGPVPSSQILQSVELDQAQLERIRNAEVMRLNGLMQQRNEMQQNWKYMMTPPGRR